MSDHNLFDDPLSNGNTSHTNSNNLVSFDHQQQQSSHHDSSPVTTPTKQKNVSTPSDPFGGIDPFSVASPMPTSRGTGGDSPTDDGGAGDGNNLFSYKNNNHQNGTSEHNKNDDLLSYDSNSNIHNNSNHQNDHSEEHKSLLSPTKSAQHDDDLFSLENNEKEGKILFNG